MDAARLAGLVAIVAACSSRTSSPAPGATGTGASSTDAKSGVTAAAPADAATAAATVPAPIDGAPAPAPVALAPLGDLPPLYAALFVEGKRFEYRWKRRIDSHDGEGPPPFSTSKVVCRIGPVQPFDVDAVTVAKLAAFTCAVTPAPADDDGFPPEPATHWLVTRDGLRRADELEDLDDLREALASTPVLLAAAPAARETSTTSDDEPAHRAWEKIFPRGKGWCAESGSDEFYGSLDRACFEPGRGLVSLTLEGREGPSEETYTLTAVK